MSRITKQLASDMAKALMQSRYDKVDAAKTELKNIAEELQFAEVPEQIKSVFKGHFKSWLNTQSYGYFSGSGMNGRENFDFTKEIPYKGPISLKAHQVDMLITAKDNYEDLRVKYRDHFKQVEVTLLNLRTYKNVETSWPEAAVFLPKVSGVTTAIALNISDVKKLL